MNIFQFIRIVLAHKMLIVGMTVACALAGLISIAVLKPRYEAQSRVMLDVIKPDPVTGEVMATAFLRAYGKTQVELVKDQQVANRVIQDLGWASDPAIQGLYEGRRFGRSLSFPQWAAKVIMSGADAKLIEGSNILEISYTSGSPTRAKAVADALRNAYIDQSLQSRQDAARKNANWYEAQAEKSKAILLEAESRRAKFERENGVLLQDNKIDVDSARLAALATQGSGPMIAPAVGEPPSATQLAQVQGEIAEASKALGPNHPTLQALKAREAALSQQVARERSQAASAANVAAGAARVTGGMLDAQKAKVMNQREKVERARLMQDEIDLRRDQYAKAMARAAQFRQEAEVADSGVVPLASAVTPQSPVFPKKPLVLGGATFGGFGLGLVLALILELIGRRVRSADDLRALVDAPVLATISSQEKARKMSWKRWIRRGAKPVGA